MKAAPVSRIGRGVCLSLLLLAAGGLATAASASAYLTAPGTIWTIGGDGGQCSTPTCGDGPNALLAQVTLPRGIALDPAGNVYFSVFGQRVRRITPSGAISTIAGTGSGCGDTSGPCGDGGPATSGQLNTPSGMAIDSAGNLYVAEQNGNKVRKFTPGGTISTVAGDGIGSCTATDPCGDGNPATSAQLSAPSAVAVDTDGNLYIADQFHHKIRKVTMPAGTISTIAGDGTSCADSTSACGDGASATAAQLNFPFGVAVDAEGAVYIADVGNQKVRKVTSGVISTIAGDGTACSGPCGDGGLATSAQFNSPRSLAVDAAKRVYISDGSNHRVRMITPAGRIGPIAGTGTACATSPFCGDGGAGRAADLNEPMGLAVDAPGANLFIADLGDNLIRWVTGPQAGATGTPGTPGTPGAPGAPGPGGTDGATGPQGPRGRDARVRCTAGKPRRGRVRVICRVRLVSSSASYRIRARLSREGRTYATGRGAVHGGRTVLRMRRVRAIRPGTYTLSTRVSGRRAISRQRVIVR